MKNRHSITAVLTITLLVAGTAALAASNEAIKRNNFGAELVKQGRLDEARGVPVGRPVGCPVYRRPREPGLHVRPARPGGRGHRGVQEGGRVDPKNAIAFNNLGVLYMKKESYDEAIAAFEQGLKADPSNAMLQQNLASQKDPRQPEGARGPDRERAEEGRGAPRTPGPHTTWPACTPRSTCRIRRSSGWGSRCNLGLTTSVLPERTRSCAGLRTDPRFARLLEGR